MKRLALGVAAAAFVLAAAAVGVAQMRPPAVTPLSAAADEFSGRRAMDLLRVIAAEPHPIGSARQAVVREFITDRLSLLGLDPTVEQTTVVAPENARVAGTVHDVIGRLPGTDPTRALLLVAHYDSVPTSGGAADDGSGVAALLETARALRAGAPLRNDVLFLFTDGEERGLLGAQAFVRGPSAGEIGVVMNLDNPGSAGPSLLAETTRGDLWLVRQFAAAATYPISSSLMNEVSRRRWIESDFTPFQVAGFPGLNFAYFDGFSRNHTALDDLAHVDLRSLQHQGSDALAMTRRLGDLDLSDARRGGGDAVYFDLVGAWLVVYPMRAVPFVVLACVVLLAGVAVVGVRSRRLTAGGVARGLSYIAFAVVATVGLASLVWAMLRSAHGAQGLPDISSASDGLHELGLVCLAAAVATSVLAQGLKSVKVQDMAVAGHVVWLAFAIATAVWAPGASYLFAWPLLASLLALLAMMVLGDDPLTSLRAFVVAALGALPAILLLSAATYLFLVSAGLRPLGPAIAILLLLALLPVQLELVSRVARWLVPGLLVAAGLGMLVAGGAAATVDRAHPLQNSVFYQSEAGSGPARWLSLDDKPDLWSSQFLSASPGRSTNEAYFPRVGKADYLFAAAAPLSLEGPRMSVLSDVVADGRRTLTMRVVSPREAPVISIMVESVVGTLRAKVDGVALGSGNTRLLDGTSVRWAADYYALPHEGIVLTLSYDEPEQALRLRLMDCSYGLPAVFSRYYKTRPDFMVPGGIGDATFVTRTYDLPSPVAPATSAPSDRRPSPSASGSGPPSPVPPALQSPQPTASQPYLRPVPMMPARPVPLPGLP